MLAAGRVLQRGPLRVRVGRDPAKLDRRGVRGAPDWVLEVLSPATAGHDQVRKRRIYEQAGVREYWMVHPADRVMITR